MSFVLQKILESKSPPAPQSRRAAGGGKAADAWMPCVNGNSPFVVASTRQVKFRRVKKWQPGGAGCAIRILLRHSAPPRARFTPQITQCVPYSSLFSAVLLNITVMNKLIGCLMRNLKTKPEKIMKKSQMMLLAGTLLAAGSLTLSARAQNDVYAVEFNTGDNGFGIINLMNGSFTQISDLGSTLYNDIA
ncbi:MAG: hypothetical protein ACLP2Y_06915, partial [Limisphaerales bacterium]